MGNTESGELKRALPWLYTSCGCFCAPVYSFTVWQGWRWYCSSKESILDTGYGGVVTLLPAARNKQSRNVEYSWRRGVSRVETIDMVLCRYFERRERKVKTGPSTNSIHKENCMIQQSEQTTHSVRQPTFDGEFSSQRSDASDSASKHCERGQLIYQPRGTRTAIYSFGRKLRCFDGWDWNKGLLFWDSGNTMVFAGHFLVE